MSPRATAPAGPAWRRARIGAPPRLGARGRRRSRSASGSRAARSSATSASGCAARPAACGPLRARRSEPGWRTAGAEPAAPIACRQPDAPTRHGARPRRGALLVGYTRIEPHHAIDLRQPLRPACRGLDVGGDHQRSSAWRPRRSSTRFSRPAPIRSSGLGDAGRSAAARPRTADSRRRDHGRRQEGGAGRADGRETRAAIHRRDRAAPWTGRLGVDQPGERLELVSAPSRTATTIPTRAAPRRGARAR